MTETTHVRFSFEAATLRHAVELAKRLRGVIPNGVRVRPTGLSRAGSCQWAIYVTMNPRDATETAAFENEIRRLARQAPGVRFTGWLSPSLPEEDASPGDRSATTGPAARVLIVDDSAGFRRAARELIERRGYHVVGEVDSAAAGVYAVERLKPDAVLLDVRLPDGSGLDLCELLAREQNAPAILLVANDGAANAALATSCGARGFMTKGDLPHADFRGIWG